VLIALSATAGAASIVFGSMLLIGHIETTDLTSGFVTERLHDDGWWYVLYVVLALIGATAQIASRRAGAETLRSRWDNERAFHPAR
jgi:hypothetical protein